MIFSNRLILIATTGLTSSTSIRAPVPNESPAGIGRPVCQAPSAGRKPGRCGAAGVRQLADACIQEAASAYAARPPRLPWTAASAGQRGGTPTSLLHLCKAVAAALAIAFHAMGARDISSSPGAALLLAGGATRRRARGRASLAARRWCCRGGRPGRKRSSLGASSDARGGIMSELLLDAAGRRRSPATLPHFHAGRPPRNRGSATPQTLQPSRRSLPSCAPPATASTDSACAA